MQTRTKRLNKTENFFLCLCLRIKICTHQRPGRTKLLKWLYPTVQNIETCHDRKGSTFRVKLGPGLTPLLLGWKHGITIRKKTPLFCCRCNSLQSPYIPTPANTAILAISLSSRLVFLVTGRGVSLVKLRVLSALILKQPWIYRGQVKLNDFHMKDFY